MGKVELSTRREMIAMKINEFMNALITEPVPVYELSISDMTKLGESATLEFKSTLQWDVVQHNVSKELRYSSLKTIAAFLNSSGGTLVIGVEDNGNVYGLERDLVQVKNQSLDGFGQLLINLINESIGAQYSSFIKTRFEQIAGQWVCAVDVNQAPQPIFTKTSKGTEFFVRAGNTTRSLNPEETTDSVQMHWD
jgi:predicted HTH transcriptional regulator